MKIVIGLLFALGLIAIVAFGIPMGMAGNVNASNEFLRLHIRANSNSVQDQAVKYDVKRAVIDEFTPVFAFVTSREQAMNVLRDNLGRFENVSNRVLRDAGFDYTARASLRQEYFPTRNYHGFTVPAGMYDALILELGAAQGDNWWCVVYPPLCFIDNNIGGDRGVVYRSRIQEIIRRFF
ncbi:MAG: stage II sporulation protein R [Firmicutes bacterium]|nr:stage II sporulation protein R [Bacillota bacterium]